jgi:hypothetical protein
MMSPAPGIYQIFSTMKVPIKLPNIFYHLMAPIKLQEIFYSLMLPIKLQEIFYNLMCDQTAGNLLQFDVRSKCRKSSTVWCRLSNCRKSSTIWCVIKVQEIFYSLMPLIKLQEIFYKLMWDQFDLWHQFGGVGMVPPHTWVVISYKSVGNQDSPESGTALCNCVWACLLERKSG